MKIFTRALVHVDKVQDEIVQDEIEEENKVHENSIEHHANEEIKEDAVKEVGKDEGKEDEGSIYSSVIMIETPWNFFLECGSSVMIFHLVG